MANQFEIREIHGTDKGVRRGPGSVCVYLFSPNYAEIIVLFASRWNRSNDKNPGGGIEERPDNFDPTRDEARFPGTTRVVERSPEFGIEMRDMNAALREIGQEIWVRDENSGAARPLSSSDLKTLAREIEGSSVGLPLYKLSYERLIGNRSRQTYFVGVLEKKLEIVPKRIEEDGGSDYVDRQRFMPVMRELEGMNERGGAFNTIHAIGLAKGLIEMVRTDLFRTDRAFGDFLAYEIGGIDLHERLAALEKKRDDEDAERDAERAQKRHARPSADGIATLIEEGRASQTTDRGVAHAAANAVAAADEAPRKRIVLRRPRDGSVSTPVGEAKKEALQPEK